MVMQGLCKLCSLRDAIAEDNGWGPGYFDDQISIEVNKDHEVDLLSWRHAGDFVGSIVVAPFTRKFFGSKSQ